MPSRTDAEDGSRPPRGVERRGYSGQIANQAQTADGQLSLAWRAIPKSVAEARRAVSEFAQREGVDTATLAAVRVAVSEAVTNAVQHAYLDEPEAGAVRVTAERSGDYIWVAVCDEGRGMLPRADSPGIGLGLPLIARMTQGFELHERDGGGTVLRMRFAV